MTRAGRAVLPLEGQRFGKVVALDRVGTLISPRSALWRCRCDCGAETVLDTGRLKTLLEPACERCARGHVRLSSDSAYKCWRSMIARCEDPRTNGWERYGGRGIRVCAKWRRSFLTFLEDIGPRPSDEHTIDRADNDGHYEPGNVRWATRWEQAQNRTQRNGRRTFLNLKDKRQ